MGANLMRIEDWGLIPYKVALQRQCSYVEQRIRDYRPDTLIFAEHPSVITTGAQTPTPDAFSYSKETLTTLGIGVVSTNRGGALTYHAPGQLVIYPIFQLQRKDLNHYLRTLETILAECLQSFSILIDTKADTTGIWVGGHKIASIGIAIKRWVTYHGCALNIDNDLTPFSYIKPCGYSVDTHPMTSMQNILGSKVCLQQVKDRFALIFQNTFN